MKTRYIYEISVLRSFIVKSAFTLTEHLSIEVQLLKPDYVASFNGIFCFKVSGAIEKKFGRFNGFDPLIVFTSFMSLHDRSSL